MTTRCSLPRCAASMLLAVAALTGAVPCAVPPATAASASPPITAEEAHTIAMEAYLFLYPLISMDLTRRQLTNMQAGESPIGGPPNTFINVREYPAADMRAVVRPNFDTLYSSAWLDLTAGPVVVSHADTRGRYFMLPMLDMYSDVFAVPGKRTSGTAAAAYAVVPSGWNGTLPDGIGRIDAPTPHVWVIGRTQTNGPADYDAVHEIQNGFNVTPLASWGKAAAPVVVKIDPTVDMKTPPKVQADTMPAEQYFAYGAALMGTNPPHDTDWSALRRFERIGLVPGQPFTLDSLAPEVRSAITSAPADALRLMAEKTPTLARIVNGWTMNTDSMGVYGNYYLKRAIVAQVGLGANQPEDAIYPMCVAGADGKPLTGDRDYVIHFTKDDLPPAHAFWSITMYDADGFQVANPINRFAIGDRDALKFNPDGSLDIYIRHTSPGPDRESNWLPSPASGVLGVTMRLYAPAPEALDGRWNPPPVRPAKEAAQ